MTVSNKKLVELLKQKTDLDKAEVEQQLQLLIGKVHDKVEEDGTFRVKGLGEFSLKDGSLQFKAEDDLATEINHKYAGMKPLELIGAYKDTTDEESDKEKEEPAASEIGSGIEEYRQETEAEEEPIEELVPGEELMAEEEEPEEVMPELNADEETSSFELDEDVVEEEEQQQEQSADSVTNEAPPVKEKVVQDSEEKEEAEEVRKDPIGKMLVAAVVVIALGVSGWLVYDMGLLGGGNGTGNERADESLQNVTVAQNDPEATIDNDQTPDDGAVVDSAAQRGSEGGETTSEQNTTKPISNERSIAEESRQSIYGLRGGAAPRASDGYTIVVHSMRDESRIRRENNKLQQEGYRTIVSSANVMDTTYWRLGLGQFKTIKDAAEAASNLPDPYKSNHFIKRIQ